MMEGWMDGWVDEWREGARWEFSGGRVAFPTYSPALPAREGTVGDATVEASVLPFGGSRRPEGGRCELLWGSLLGARSPRCAQGVVPSPLFSGGAERPFHPRSPPLLPQPPTRDGAVCGVESPRWERYCDAAFPGRSAKPWGCGDGGKREGAHPRGGCHGGRFPGPGAWEEQSVLPRRRGLAFRRPPPSLAAAGLSPSSKSRKLRQAGEAWAGGRRRESSPCGAAPLCPPQTKRRSARGQRPGRSARGGLRRGRQGAASRRGQG